MALWLRPLLPALFLGMLTVAVAAADAAPSSSRRIRVLRDLFYGTHLLHALDLYVPVEAGKHPIVIYIHGGEFLEGDKRDHSEKGKAFARAGYLFAAVSFRLAPAYRHPLPVRDVARAVRWLKDNAEQLGGDGSTVFVMGHSSGAHLAALLATDERHLASVGLVPRDLAGVVLLDGAGYDIPLRMQGTSAHTRQVYQQAFGTALRQWWDASPTRQVRLGAPLPPFFIVYAGKASSPDKQSFQLTKVLRWAGASVERVHIPERNHVTLERNLGRPGDSPTYLIRRFLLAQEEDRALVSTRAMCPRRSVTPGLTATDFDAELAGLGLRLRAVLD